MKNLNSLLTPLLVSFFFVALHPVSGQTNRSRLKIVSPTILISDIPCDLQLQVQNADGTTDASFNGYLNGSGLTRYPDGKMEKIDSIGPFSEGKCVLRNITFDKAGKNVILIRSEKIDQNLLIHVIPGLLSLLPPLLAILLALVLRQVLIALFAGIWLGATFLNGYNPFLGLLRLLDHYLINSLADSNHAPIILFSLTLGGMVGILSRSGGTQGIIQKITRLASSYRGAQLSAWAMGLFIFFDDYANTLIVGNTMRPITDKVKISREKLAYIVDSTAATVASAALISTWIGFELGLIQSVFQSIGIERNIYFTFIQTIPYRFYGLLTIVFVFLVGFTRRDFGPMLKAEKRSLITGKVLRDNSSPLSDLSLSQTTAPYGAPLRWINAVLPILIVIVVTMMGLWYNGKTNLLAAGITDSSLKTIIGASDSFAVLMWSSFAGAFTAALLAISQKILTVRETMDAWMTGAKAMLQAIIILVFAWAISKISEDLHTADYVVAMTKDFLSPHLLPMVTFILAAFISFATGTSWGTMSILIPIVVPMAYTFSIEMAVTPDISAAILTGTIASVLSGAVFGDHCSPISDTTIMSSMASGSDHVDHVRTQMPYAILVALVSIVAGYIPAGFGYSPVISIPLGIFVMTVLLLLIGKKPVKISRIK